MPNIIKGFNCLFLCLFFGQLSYGQVLIDSDFNLDLSTNGVVYDVEYLEVLERYVVVGEFTQVGGPGNDCINIAILDSNFAFDQNANNAFLGVGTDGPIYGVESYRYSIIPGIYTTQIYVCGNFSNFCGMARNDAARFVMTDNGTSAAQQYPSSSPWNPDFDSFEILDVELWDNKVVFAGDFVFAHSSTSPVLRHGIASFFAASGNDDNTIDNYLGSTSPLVDPIRDLETDDNFIYLAGSTVAYGKMDGTTSTSNTPPSFYAAINVQELNDSLLLMGYDHTGGAGSDFPEHLEVFRKSDLSLKTDHAYSEFAVGYENNFFDYRIYDEILFACRQSGTDALLRFDIDNIDLANGITPTLSKPLICSGLGLHWPSFEDVEFGGPPAGNCRTNLIIEKNVLFTAFPNLTSADGYSRWGLAAWCLPPKKSTGFISPILTVCQNDTVTYSVAAAQYAEGYEWTYSGSGLDLNWIAFGEESLHSTTNPNIDVIILENFTPGTLTVTPYSTCNNNTVNGDRAYSDPITIILNFDVLPDADAGLDTIINCYNDSIVLTGTSITPSVNYYWNQEFNPLAVDSTGQNYLATQSDNHILKVEGTNGCIAFDTVFVDADTIRPNFDPIVTDNIGCDETLYFSGVANNTIDTLGWWEATGNDIQLPNPLEATIPGGEFWFMTQDTINGCIDSTSVWIGVDDTVPNISFVGYTYPGPVTGIDTITCADPSYSIQIFSTTSNADVNWTDQDTSILNGDTQFIDSAGIYYIYAYNNNNNCSDFIQVLIAEDTGLPPAPTFPLQSTAINCSNDSLILNGITGVNDSILTWTGPFISPSPNPVTIFNPGYYTLTVTKNDNGCSASDSIQVIQDNSIDIITSGDTYACDQDAVNVTATYVGTITGINYLWDNGTTSANASYIAGTDNQAIIEISGDGGCYGTDTIQIAIPPFPAISINAFGPCGVPNTGYMVINPISGWAPFEYSIDGGITFQTSSTISGLDIGTYTVTVMDTLGCTYDFPAEVSDDASPPTPDFLLSTYNYESDTIALVNVSNPMPDSVDWVFPPSFIVIDDNDTLPLVILPDTGTFVVTMDAYYGACVSSFSKTIYVTEFDTTLATAYNDNGIKSVELYPNPNTGDFTIEVEFYKKQNATIIITDMSGTVFEEFNYNETDLITEPVQMVASAGNGTYVLRVASEYDGAYITFIINE